MTKQDIELAKGKLVVIKYGKIDGLINTISGEIKDFIEGYILFAVNNSELKIKLKPSQILEIADSKEKLKEYK